MKFNSHQMSHIDFMIMTVWKMGVCGRCIRKKVVLAPFSVQKINTRKNHVLTHGGEELIDCEYFRVVKYQLTKQSLKIMNHTYALCSVFDGVISVNGEEFVHGEHFICTSKVSEMDVQGSGILFVTTAKIKE